MKEHTLPPVCTAQSRAYAHWLNPSPKHAFLIAALATLVHPAASFVEGWICLHWQGDLLLWEHAWCQTPTGIVDPTLAVFPSTATPLSYHPGASYSQATLWQRWQEGVSFPLTRLWAGEEETASHPSYGAAFTAASAHAHSW